MRPCKIQCTFYCHRVVKIIAPFYVYVGPPPLGSKWPQRTKLSDGVGCQFCFFSFSQRKWGVCPKKVGKMAFIGCSEFQWTKFAWKLLIELKRYRSKVKVFWNAWAVGFQMVKLKNLSCTKIIVHGRTLLKSVSAVGFTEKTKFFGKCLFSRWNVLCD